jgi:dihydroneopterin aldolase
MTEFRAPWVKVSVTKLAALKDVKRVGITIERGKRQ